MKTPTLSALCLTLLLGTVPIAFSSGTAVALSDKAVQVRADQAVERSRNPVGETVRSQRASTVLAEKEERFTDKKLQRCNKSQDGIKLRMQQISNRGVKQLEVFRKIADRTKAFYETKGYSAERYPALAAEVDLQYEQSVAALRATQSSQNEWSCDSSNPLRAMSGFSDAKKNEIAALRAYKDKVRELILLVKQAGGTQ